MMRLFGILILKCLAFILDDYSKQYKYYPYKIEWVQRYQGRRHRMCRCKP